VTPQPFDARGESPLGKDGGSLVARCLDGDASGWEAVHGLFRPLCREIVRSALRRAGLPSGEPEIDDIAHDFFAHLAEEGGRRLGLYRGDAPLHHYLAVLASNFADARARDQKRRRCRELPLDETVSEVRDSRRDASGGLERKEELSRLKTAVEALPPADRLLFELVYRDEVETDVVCRMLRLSPNALYIRKNRLKEKIRTLLVQDEPGGHS